MLATAFRGKSKFFMNKQLVFNLLALISLFSFNTSAQNAGTVPEKPRLIVQITVSNMRYDYLQRYWYKFGTKGFRVLVRGGVNCQNARFNYLLTQPYPGLASISCGCNPAVHGIVANKWYFAPEGHDIQEVDATADSKTATVGGSFTQGMHSAKQLITSTLTDELQLQNSRSKVVGIALDAGSAILPTGHCATGVFWLDNEKGGWVSSSYFCDRLPAWVDTLNGKGLGKFYNEKDWLLSQPVTAYQASDTTAVGSAEQRERIRQQIVALGSGVLHTAKRNNQWFNTLHQTPLGNQYTEDMAIAAILGEGLGEDAATDFLSVAFTANRQIAALYGPHSIEMEDAYLKLDEQIAHLLNFIDQTVGLQNTLVILTSDCGIASNPNVLKQNKLPSGYFNPVLSSTLLNSYLKAIYGDGQWVSAYSQKQIYLNRKLIKSRKLKLHEVQQTVADFMVEFNGVNLSVTGHSMRTTCFDSGLLLKFQNSYNPRRSGDVMINLEPGWVEKDCGVSGANSGYDYDTHVPLVLYGWAMKPAQISCPVDMTHLAPTLAALLGIANPNGSTGQMVEEILKAAGH